MPNHCQPLTLRWELAYCSGLEVTGERKRLGILSRERGWFGVLGQDPRQKVCCGSRTFQQRVRGIVKYMFPLMFSTRGKPWWCKSVLMWNKCPLPPPLLPPSPRFLTTFTKGSSSQWHRGELMGFSAPRRAPLCLADEEEGGWGDPGYTSPAFVLGVGCCFLYDFNFSLVD